MSKKEQFIAAPPDADLERDENYETQKKVLSLKLRKLVAAVVSVAVIYVVLLFIVLIVQFIINTYIVNGIPFSWSHFRHLIDFVRLSLMLFVYALPLALPVALAIIWRQRGHYTVRLRKFLHYQLPVNGVATLVAFIVIIIVRQYVVSFFQILFINLIYGCLAAVALTISTHPGATYSLANDNQPIVTRRLLVNMKGQAIYQAIVLFALVFCGAYLFGIDDARYHGDANDASQHFTLVFNTFALMSIFNQINARRVFGERNVFQNIHKDYLFVGVFILELIIQALTVQIGCDFLSTVPLTFAQWLWSIAFALVGLLVHQALLTIPIRRQ